MQFEGIHCRLAIERPADAVIVVRLTGWDVGELGDAPLKELDKLLAGAGPFVQLTAKFVQRFAELGEVMRIYTDAAAFDAVLRKIGL